MHEELIYICLLVPWSLCNGDGGLGDLQEILPSIGGFHIAEVGGDCLDRLLPSSAMAESDVFGLLGTCLY
jgi:hypothetical protein